MIYTIGIPRLISFDDMKTADVSDLIEWLKDKKEIQIDTETEYNDRNKKALPNPYEHKVLSLQVGDFNDQWVIDPNVVSVQFLKPYFEDKSIVKVLCNAFFDLRFFYHWGFNTKNVYDCFLAELSLTLGQKMPKGYRGLGQMTERYCEAKLDKEVRGQIHQRGLDDTVIRYAANDVKYMSQIKAKQAEKVTELALEKTLRLENRFVCTLARISYKGFKIDSQRVLKISQANKVESAKLQQKLSDLVVNLGVEFAEFIDTQVDMFSEGIKTKINWASPKQVIKLFKQIGVNCQVRDKVKGGMKDSVDGRHLSRQKSKFPVIPIYLAYKEVEKEITTYGEKFIKNNMCPVTNRMHTEFFPILETGRISSSNPNLQNITATDGGEVSPLRECFIPEKGNSLIIADYSQQEPRLTAEYSQDPYLIDFILNGDGDSHSLVSTAISEYLLGMEVKVSKSNNPLVPQYQMKIRDIGKMINLGLDYGKTAFSVKDDLNCSQDEAQTLIDVLKAKTPGKQAYFKKWINFAKQNGYVRIDEVTNRISYFSGYKEFVELGKIPYDDKTKEQISKYYKLRGSLERFAQNYRIQGSGGAMTKIAAILFEDKIEELKLNAFIVNLVHDEIVVECKTEQNEQVQKVLEEAMIKSGTYFCKTIPMKVEAYVGKSWGVKH